jgi:hypothetical protein
MSDSSDQQYESEKRAVADELAALTWHGTSTPAAGEQAQGTSTKRKHVRGATGRKPGPPKTPLTTEQKEQAIALSAGGYSANRISKIVGRDRAAIKRHLATDEAAAAVEDERAEMVQLCRDKARACVVGINDEKISKANVLQLSTSAGILIDKAQLLDGMPTSINVHVVALMDVLDTLRMRRDEEDERQFQQEKAARALLSLPANQA